MSNAKNTLDWPPLIGKTYQFRTHRHGTFVMRVESADDEWASGVIVSGTAKYMSRDDKEAGEHMTVRRSLCEFIPEKDAVL